MHCSTKFDNQEQAERARVKDVAVHAIHQSGFKSIVLSLLAATTILRKLISVRVASLERPLIKIARACKANFKN